MQIGLAQRNPRISFTGGVLYSKKKQSPQNTFNQLILKLKIIFLIKDGKN